MEWLFFWIVLSIVAGVIASNKGRSGFGYFMLSLIISPLLAIVIVLVLPSTQNRDQEAARKLGEAGEFRKCPACAEAIRREAIKCRYCGTDVAPMESAAFQLGKQLGASFKADK